MALAYELVSASHWASSAQPGLEHLCVQTVSLINLWIKRSWPFVFMYKNMSGGKETKQRDGENDSGLKVKSRFVLVLNSAPTSLC